ncbi:alpha-hydroxy acid oxidase [Nioella ostreopsis]|uniref:alpha-hydroxy acid oxidase n=1 Tax=Nioella ostreopsis TaxID=2448479 RepID=UPI0030B82F7C
MPRVIFDFIEGAAGREVATARNQTRFDEITLQPRVLENVGARRLETRFLGRTHGLPFGIAPMGMCNLTHPDADRALARAASRFDIPLCLSSAASSSIEEMRDWAEDHAWFQLYVGASMEQSLDMVHRAKAAGYDTLILTVDVPQVARRTRDLRNGFQMPFRMTPRLLWDFASHPSWSLSMLWNGAPEPRNFSTSATATRFDRSASRAGADWAFLDRLRDLWPGRLIVKGVSSPPDARRIQAAGVDAIQVSNHGGRQLDSVPAAIDLLPHIRAAVGPDYPLIFDSGLRHGEDIVKALARGADFVMLGRPLLYALGAEGARGLNALIRILAEETSLTLAQVGLTDISAVGAEILADASDMPKPEPATRTALKAY